MDTQLEISLSHKERDNSNWSVFNKAELLIKSKQEKFYSWLRTEGQEAFLVFILKQVVTAFSRGMGFYPSPSWLASLYKNLHKGNKKGAKNASGPL